MKRLFIVIALVAFIALLWLLWKRDQKSRTVKAESTPEEQAKAGFAALESVYNEAKRLGILTRNPPVAEALAQAIASGDRGEISRAFNDAIYERLQDLNESRAACLELLKHEDWFVRKEAAESLYTMGDASGFEVLRDLLLSSSPLMYADGDERILIGINLGQWREKRAGPAILDAYKRTEHRELIFPMLTLGVADAVAIYTEMTGGMISAGSAEVYGKTNATEFKEELLAAYNNMANGSEDQIYTAWALYKFSGERGYLDTVRQQAESAQKGVGNDYSRNTSTLAFRCLASIRDAEVKRIMEESLQLPSRSIREAAAASLLLVQEGPSEPLRAVLKEHVGTIGSNKFGLEVGYQMAAHLDDPEVNAAGAANDRQIGERRWHLYGVKRKNWPVYPWADGLLILP